MNRRSLLSAAAPAALALVGTAAGVAVQAAAPAAAPSFYSTLDPKEKASFDRLYEIVKAQADGTWIEPPDPDAALHARCAEFQRLHALAYLDGYEDWEAAHAESWRVADEIDDMVAVTDAGHRAKARIAVAQMDANRCNGVYAGDRDALFALNTLKDWLGWPG